MEQFTRIIFSEYARREWVNIPEEIKTLLRELIVELDTEGYLVHPDGRRLTKELFEIRVRMGTSWRGIYCYSGKKIVLLSFFQKQSQKTPQNELKKAKRRFSQLKF